MRWRCASPKPDLVEEVAHQRDALGARRKGAIADEAGIADFGAELAAPA